MLRGFGVLICFMLCWPVYADTDTFAQLGTFQIQVQNNNWQASPGVITFPQQFGAVPQVIVSFSSLGPMGFPPSNRAPATFLKVVPGNITTTGFTPIISGSGSTGTGPLAMNWVAVGSRLYNGTATGNYLVLTVIYAPPGTNGGKASSSVSYGAGVTSGNTTSATQSFKQSIGVSVSNQGGFLGSSASGSVSFSYTTTTTDTQSLEIKQSTTTTIQRTGPAQDGINHDEDAIYLLLKPQIALSLSSSAASWTFGDNSTSPIQYVLVGELNGHYAWRTGVLAQLTAAGVSAADYPNILASDPLAGNPSVLDPTRFSPANTMYPYEPPATPNDPVIAIMTTISDSSTATSTTKTEYSTNIALTVSGTAGFLDMANTTLKATGGWTWTSTNSTSTSSGTTQSASATLGGPAYGYQGVTEVAVYKDTIYNTFAFVLVPPQSSEVALSGTVTTAAGAPIPGTEVTLTESGIKHRTFTNAKGGYVFFGRITGPATIQAAGVTRSVAQAQPARGFDVQVP
jgi:H-type lectin domain